ncbi:hypothetical protein BMF94_1731 [Rhodotorula taiwanensis]|uniref:Uncharacterized protein n=1 Tax=Rhodotorula taiwanensis TaxID=741276 RepID=A0A2S5BEB5_9BASI|nr:hypothetical protein BMF94_1731 [Rhodotorula taiwanensis]
MPSRRPPPHPLRLTNSATAELHAPAFGKIPTYSYRLPHTSRRRWSAKKSSRQSPTTPETNRGIRVASNTERASSTAVPLRSPRSPRIRTPRSADPTEILHAIALAEVSLRGPFRQRSTIHARPVAARTQNTVSMMVQPATPQESFSTAEGAVLEPSVAAVNSETTLKRPRRNASAPSIISFAEAALQGDDAIEVVRSAVDASRPDSYQPPDMTGLSGLSIAQFDVHGRSHSSSSTETLVEPGWCKAPKQVPIDLKPGRGTQASPTVALSPGDCRIRVADVPKSYLCPWEEQPPPVIDERSLPPPVLATTSAFIRPVGAGRWRRKHFVTAALVVLTVLVFADLVALNARVWSTRDAYYDE